MRWRAWRAVQAAGLVLACAAALAAETTRQVAVQVEIRDELTGSDLEVSIRRNVAAGTEAIDLLDEIVDLEVRRYPGVGVFVTSLCGVTAPKGTFWALSINGERATIGISDLTIDEPVHLRWALVKLEDQ
ncbi:MAG: DUF4430 domain-containing protein [Pseudomonadales bacterium]|nr:DUF4430 domain-containing protein [Pseudomonadales bacterium]